MGVDKKVKEALNKAMESLIPAAAEMWRTGKFYGPELHGQPKGGGVRIEDSYRPRTQPVWEDSFMFAVWSEWDIGQEGIIFKSVEDAHEWLLDNGPLKACYTEGLSGGEAIDDLISGGLLG